MDINDIEAMKHSELFTIRHPVFERYIIPSNSEELMIYFDYLDTTNYLLTPLNIPTRVLVTSGDVLHSWTVPSLGRESRCLPRSFKWSNLSTFSNWHLLWAMFRDLRKKSQIYTYWRLKWLNPHWWTNTL